MAKEKSWKLQDVKARFSEIVRNARTGEPQRVTIRDKEFVVVVDPEHFEVRRKVLQSGGMSDLVEASRKYRGLGDGIKFER